MVQVREQPPRSGAVSAVCANGRKSILNMKEVRSRDMGTHFLQYRFSEKEPPALPVGQKSSDTRTVFMINTRNPPNDKTSRFPARTKASKRGRTNAGGKSFVTGEAEMSISYSVCAKRSQQRKIQKIKADMRELRRKLYAQRNAELAPAEACTQYRHLLTCISLRIHTAPFRGF